MGLRSTTIQGVRMKRFKTAALAAGLAAFAAYSAQAADFNLKGWYIGADVGQSHYGQKGDGLDGAFASRGFSSSSSIDTNDTGSALDVGYQFNKWFAVEGGYIDLGKFDFASNLPSSAPGAMSGRVKSEGARLTAVGIIPLDHGFSLYGKAGIAQLRTQLGGCKSARQELGSSHQQTSGTVRLGATYDITKAISARICWGRFMNANDNTNTGKADIELLSPGLVYRF